MKQRALVLGGGGPVGIGWEVGLLAGLVEAGADTQLADFIVGTSAGAFVGALIATGTNPADIAATQRVESGASSEPARDSSEFQRKMIEAGSGARPPEQIYAEIGAFAREAKTMSEDDFVSLFAYALASNVGDRWPTRDFACTAFNAETGALQIWNRESNIALTRAIASSCAVPGIFPPITLGQNRYVDGALRSSSNAHLAEGYERVLVVALRVGEQASELSRKMGKQFEEQTDRELGILRSSGAKAMLITPDEMSLKAFGPNLMDSAKRAGAVDEGMRQGRECAEEVATFWN